jgi:hypothetical protein
MADAVDDIGAAQARRTRLKKRATLADHLVVGRDIPGALDLFVWINKAIAAPTNDDTPAKIVDKYATPRRPHVAAWIAAAFTSVPT